MIKHIAIAGHIGVGKSSLTHLLSQELGVAPFHEPNLENPFLERFYGDMSAWAFHSQVFFLVHKFNAHRRLLEGGAPMIQDRTIYEDAEVFAEHLHRSGHMLDDEFNTYKGLYAEFRELLPPPSLMIYLRARVDTLLDRIKLRGRPEEQAIPREYMESLHALYEAWFERYDASPKIVIELDALDFVRQPEDRAAVIARVSAALSALESASP
jgi:deoxyadenosine/deoxycytidine kinase